MIMQGAKNIAKILLTLPKKCSMYLTLSELPPFDDFRKKQQFSVALPTP